MADNDDELEEDELEHEEEKQWIMLTMMMTILHHTIPNTQSGQTEAASGVVPPLVCCRVPCLVSINLVTPRLAFDAHKISGCCYHGSWTAFIILRSVA